ncbi:hypothetical protein CXB51_016039 [Gossypium anomalum]|uniref:DUF7745 domain-containing protein n=1 Tax=Gossypium anomalum TaxID=47600 RepID=A0A8J5YV82_9ROSI|nr:hypothetical protein CXB51_016039 [Gossypium anomalum]
MGHDRGSVLILVDDSTDDSSTHLEPKPHIVNHTSHPTRAMPNLRLFSSHQNKFTGETPLTFCIFIPYARWLGLFNNLDRKEKEDSLVEGCVANLPEHVTMNVHQNNLENLVQIWNQWDSDTRGIFTERRTIDPSHGQILGSGLPMFYLQSRRYDSTIEEYVALLRVENAQFYKVYVKKPKPMTFKKNSRHLEVAVVDFFERLKQGINPIPTILAETFRSLSNCQRKGEERFFGFAQLLIVWILSHFWKVERTPFHMFSKTFAPLEAYLKKEWPKEVTEQHWVSVFQNLCAEDVTWRAPWIRPSVLLYKVGDQDWVPLLGLWGGVGYAPLLVQRQFSSR